MNKTVLLKQVDSNLKVYENYLKALKKKNSSGKKKEK